MDQNNFGLGGPLMDLVVEGSDDQPILCARGEIDFSTNRVFESSLVTLAERRPSKLIVDLSAVSFLDSSGLHTLIAVSEQLSQHDGSLVLRRPANKILKIIEITGTICSFIIEE